MSSWQTIIDSPGQLTTTDGTKTNIIANAIEYPDCVGMLDIKVAARRVSDGLMKMFEGSACYSSIGGVAEICGINDMRVMGTPEELAAFPDVQVAVEIQGSNFCIAVTGQATEEFDWAALARGFNTNHVVEE